MNTTKLISLLGMVLSNFFTSYGQEFPNLLSSNRVTTVAYYEMGESRLFHVVNSSVKTKNDKKKPEKESITEYDINITVEEQLDSSYIMEMVYSNFKFPLSKTNKDLTNALAELSEGLKIRYSTNELGGFDSIINKPELAKELAVQLEEIISMFDNYFEKEEEKVAFKSIMEHYTKTLLLPENIEALYSEDILKIHGYYGFEITLGKPIQIELDYSTLNNFVLSGIGTLTLNTINKEADSFSFMTNESPNKEELNNYLKSFFKIFMMENIGEKVNFNEFKFTTKSKSKFTFELSTGWLKNATHTSTNTFTYDKNAMKTVTKTTIVALN